jgi:jouberin
MMSDDLLFTKAFVFFVRFNITQQFVGATNYREHLHSTVTPCGTFVLSGSEDGRAYVWNCDSGDQVAVYSDLGFGHPVSDVAFHPHDHIVAFCSFGDNQPVLIYKYEAEGTGYILVSSLIPSKVAGFL